jgi:hypothetical protein
MPHPYHPSWVHHHHHHHHHIWWRVQVMNLFMSLLQPPETSALLVPNILLSTLFSNTVNQLSSLSRRDQVSCSHKTGKTTVL